MIGKFGIDGYDSYLDSIQDVTEISLAKARIRKELREGNLSKEERQRLEDILKYGDGKRKVE